jgi:hypothetical protein
MKSDAVENGKPWPERTTAGRRTERTCLTCGRLFQVMSDKNYSRHPECQRKYDADTGYTVAK